MSRLILGRSLVHHSLTADGGLCAAALVFIIVRDPLGSDTATLLCAVMADMAEGSDAAKQLRARSTHCKTSQRRHTTALFLPRHKDVYPQEMAFDCSTDRTRGGGV